MQILCATDFTKPALDAADVAAAIAKKLNLPLCLMHCGEDWIVMGELPVVEPDDTLAREKLAGEAQRLRAKGIEVTTEFHRGSAGLEVSASAGSRDTRMIVLGTMGKGVAEHFLTGSVAERAAATAPVPTLIVRDARPLLAWLRDGASLSVLCGVDFSVSSDAAVAAIKDLRALGTVDIGAAYISPSLDQVETESAKTNLQRDVWERLHSVLGDVPVKVHVRSAAARPSHQLLRLAEEQKTELLVVGAHQRSGWSRLLKGSFSHTVVAHAGTNVLCVPLSSYTPEHRVPSIHRVLVATDFSERGNDAVLHAYSLVPAGGEIRLLHVCYTPSAGINPLIASEVYFDHTLTTAKAKEDAEAKMQTLVPELLATSGAATTSEVVVHHDIATAICEAADRFGADVICMGTKGHTRAGAALLGSTVQAVLARSHKSVFVVTPPRA